MKRRVFAMTGIAGLCLAVLTVGSACDSATNPQALVVLGNVIPDKEGGLCVVRSSGGGGQQSFLSQGTLDLSVTTRYTAFMLVANELPDFESTTGFQPEDGRLESGTVRVRRLRTTFRMDPTKAAAAANNAPALFAALQIQSNGSFTVVSPATGAIAPGSQSAVIADIVPEHVGQFLRAIQDVANGENLKLTLEITIEGVRADGGEIKSGGFLYSITACDNCLVYPNLPVAQARSPFIAADGGAGGVTADDLVGDACVLGNDVTMSNGACGLLYGAPTEDTLPADECALQRCLGIANAPGLVALQCPADTPALPAPNP